ncbi:unnamed protein product [Caenorhabditis brenneri]
MGRVKGSMLILHLLTAWLDVLLTILVVPVIFFAVPAGYPLGLLVYLGVSPTVMLYLFYFSMFFLLVNIVCFFENRYNYLVRHDSDTPSRKMKRSILYFFNYFQAFICVLLFLNGGGVDGYSEVVLQTLPCLPRKILENSNFYTITLDLRYTVPAVIFYVSFVWGQIGFYFTATSYHLYRTKAQSSRTSRLQKQFFKTLCVQISVPFCFFMIPATYFIYTFFSESFDMSLNTLGLIVASSHGLVSTLIMLLAHKPYREATLEFFGIRRNVNTVSFLVPKPSISNVK